jgi:hypothetical protein
MSKCPQCNSDVGFEDMYCPECGILLLQAQPPPDTTDHRFQLPSSLGSWKTLKWLVIVVLTLIILTILCGAGAIGILLRVSGVTQLVQTSVIKVVTATATATATSTPGPSPTPTSTGTPTPTATPVPTPTPMPTAAPNSVLKPGEKWYGNGLSLLL